METPGVGERGKNWATKHDFEVLLEQVRATTRAMEAIRNELSGQRWVEQERWKFKAELYRTLIENLSEVGVAWDAAYDVLKVNDFTTVSVEAFGRAIDEAEAMPRGDHSAGGGRGARVPEPANPRSVGRVP